MPDLVALYGSGREGGGGPGRPAAAASPFRARMLTSPSLPKTDGSLPAPVAAVPWESVKDLAAHAHPLEARLDGPLDRPRQLGDGEFRQVGAEDATEITLHPVTAWEDF